MRQSLPVISTKHKPKKTIPSIEKAEINVEEGDESLEALEAGITVDKATEEPPAVEDSAIGSGIKEEQEAVVQGEEAEEEEEVEKEEENESFVDDRDDAGDGNSSYSEVSGNDDQISDTSGSSRGSPTFPPNRPVSITRLRSVIASFFGRSKTVLKSKKKNVIQNIPSGSKRRR